MILYNENGEFLGISSETVSFLGYEDTNEFLSLYSDFADLLVEKEGKIYKFKNFSWIDFILYSGAPNKSAVVKMKDGNEADIRLTVKEIILAKELGGIKRCYGVRIISDEFVKIASKVDSNMKFKVSDKKVSLNNLLNDTSSLSLPKESKEQEVKEKDLEIDSLSMNYKDSKKDEEKKLNFDFPPADELKSSVDDELLLDLNANEEKNNDEKSIKFDFDNKNENTKESEEIMLDFSKEVHDEANSSSDLGDLLKIDDVSNEDKTEEEETNESQLSFLKSSEDSNSQKLEKSSEDTLSFLKIEDEKNSKSEENIQDFENKNSDVTENNLDFLKITEDSINDTIFEEKKNTPKEENKDDLTKENKEEVINQIKSDIKEIDEDPKSIESEDEDVIIKSGDFIRKVFS